MAHFALKLGQNSPEVRIKMHKNNTAYDLTPNRALWKVLREILIASFLPAATNSNSRGKFNIREVKIRDFLIR